MKRTLLAIVAALLLLAADTPSVNQMYEAGETLDFNLTWLKMTGGTARMTITPAEGDRFRITSIAETSSSFSRFFRVHDEIESVVDRASFTTLHFRKVLHEGKKSSDRTTVIDPVKHQAVHRGDEVSTVPTPVFDPLSLIYHFRRLELTPGKTHRFPVFADGKLYTLEATVGARETVTTPAGTFKTVSVQPRMEMGGIFRDDKGKLTIWYSDDARHLPVRISTDVKVGSITATLRAVTSGVKAVEPAASDQSK